MSLARLAARWNGFWFAPLGPHRLGLARCLFAGALFFHYRLVDFRVWAEADETPLSWLKWLSLPVLPGPALGALQLAWLALLALGCLGLFTRAALAAAAAVGLYLLTLQNSFVAPLKHEDLAAFFGLAVLAATPCGDAFSLDRRLFGWRQGARRRVASFRAEGRYAWGPKLLCAYVALVFFGAGVSKLRHGGLGWITSTNLMRWVAYLQVPASGASYQGPLTRWGAAFPRLGPGTNVIAALVVALELSYPLALFSRRARAVLVPASLMMLASFRLIYGPCFATVIFCSGFWIPWERIAAGCLRALRRWTGPPARVRSLLALAGATAVVLGMAAPYLQLSLYLALLAGALAALFWQMGSRLASRG